MDSLKVLDPEGPIREADIPMLIKPGRRRIQFRKYFNPGAADHTIGGLLLGGQGTALGG